MLTRRTFIQGGGALAAGAVASGTSFLESEIKEHGIVKIRFQFYPGKARIVKSTIFSDGQRGVFGIRLLGELELHETRLVEMPISDAKDVAASSGKVWMVPTTVWAEDGKKEETSVGMVVKDGNLMFASENGEVLPIWMSLSDVRQVL